MARCANVLLWNEQREMELTRSRHQVQPYIDAMLENANNLNQVSPALLLGADERGAFVYTCAGAARVRGAESQQAVAYFLLLCCASARWDLCLPYRATD
jgi:hypothetical protein